MISVPASSGYRWIDIKLQNSGSGFVPSKTGQKTWSPKKLSSEHVEELKKIIVDDISNKYGIKTRT